MLFAVRIGEQYRPTRDLDLLGMGEATEAGVNRAIREIAATKVDDDGLVFDVDTLEVHAIREANRYGGLRAVMLTRLGHARFHVQIDVGFGDAMLCFTGHLVVSRIFASWNQISTWLTRLDALRRAA